MLFSQYKIIPRAKKSQNGKRKEMSMNTNQKKIGNRASYIVLALLAVSIVALTVIAIATAVGNRGDELPDDSIIDSDTPTNGEPDETPDTPNNPDTPNDGENTPEPIKKYHTPASGELQKSYSEDVLVFSATMNDHRIHLGLDIAGKVGDPVYSFAEGTVEKIFSDPFMGKTVIINHGNGLKSHYMNLSDALADGIAEGVTVTGGSVIGAIGETAIAECADEPHLHFEIRVNDARVDPTTYITVPTMSEPEYEG